jgi:hypothetical protein
VSRRNEASTRELEKAADLLLEAADLLVLSGEHELAAELRILEERIELSIKQSTYRRSA